MKPMNDVTEQPETWQQAYQQFLTQMMNLYAEYTSKLHSLRQGQAIYNCMTMLRPDLANELNGTLADPYYDDERLPMFWEALESVFQMKWSDTHDT